MFKWLLEQTSQLFVFGLLLFMFLGMSPYPYRGRGPLEAALSEDTPKFHGKWLIIFPNGHKKGVPSGNSLLLKIAIEVVD